MARARRASECRRHVQSQRARQRPAHPNGPALSELSNRRADTALERKRPVKNPSTPSTPATPSTPHPKLGNVPTQTVHRMHVPRKHCVYMSSPGEPGHTHGTHTRHGRTRAHGCTDHTDETHNHPNPPTLHERTHTHDDRNRQQPQSCNLIQKLAVLGRKFRCSDMLAASKDCAQGDASKRCIERSSQAKTRQKALMALYGFRSTSGKRSSEFQGRIREERSTPSSCDGVECKFAFPDGGAPSGASV